MYEPKTLLARVYDELCRILNSKDAEEYVEENFYELEALVGSIAELLEEA